MAFKLNLIPVKLVQEEVLVSLLCSYHAALYLVLYYYRTLLFWVILVFPRNEIMHFIFHINDSITFCTTFRQYLPRSKLFVTMDIFALRFKYSYRMNTLSIFFHLILEFVYDTLQCESSCKVTTLPGQWLYLQACSTVCRVVTKLLQTIH